MMNSIAQKRLSQTIENMAANVKSLAAPADAKTDASVDQILAAAAAKLIQQDQQINQLKGSIRNINHPPDGLYVNDMMVARTAGNIVRSGSSLKFQLVIAGGSGLDFNQDLSYQDMQIKCMPPDISGGDGNFGVMMTTRYPNVSCTILH